MTTVIGSQQMALRNSVLHDLNQLGFEKVEGGTLISEWRHLDYPNALPTILVPEDWRRGDYTALIERAKAALAPLRAIYELGWSSGYDSGEYDGSHA